MSHRRILIIAALMAVVGCTLNDWLPTGLLHDVGALGNTDRRDALRGFSLFLVVTAVFLTIWRDWVSRNTGGLVAFGVSTALSLLLFVAVDLFLTNRAINAQIDSRDISNVHRADDVLGWRPAACTIGYHQEVDSFSVEYRIDQNGYKAVDNHGPGLSRIFIFGDSYTFGHGVSNRDTYANIMAEDYLADTVHVFNVGVMGYGIVQMFGRFLEIESQLRDNDVVLFAPTSQDLKRNLKDFVFPSKLIFGKRIGFGDRYPVYVAGKIESVELASGFNRTKALFFNGRWTKNIFRFTHSAVVSPATTAEAIEMLEQVRELTVKRGARFQLVFLPQTKERLRNRYEEGVSFFKFDDIMRFFPGDEAELAKLRFKTDSHWNRKGHELAAKAVVSTLLANKLILPGQIKRFALAKLGTRSESVAQP